MTGHLMAEWAERDFTWDAYEGLKNPSGIARLNRSMEQACEELNAEYERRCPDEHFKIHPFDLKMQCDGPCWARNGVLRPDMIGKYHEIRAQAVYFCRERECRARLITERLT